MDTTRIEYLRGELEAERISYGELLEIQSAFETIDHATLPEPAENATAADMLDEIEARALAGEVAAILARKAGGQDCTDDESATLKLYMRTGPGGYLKDRAAKLFPLEWDEMLSESER